MFNTLNIPLSSREFLSACKAGDLLLINGIIYTARDQAHKRLFNELSQGLSSPIELNNTIIYYCGPTPLDDNNSFRAAGPTTSSRMDKYAPFFYDNGVLATIGKGKRDISVIESCKKNKSYYFVAFGGAGAFYAKKIVKNKLICYEDLGPEAIYELEVKDFPVIVGIDSYGNYI